MKLALASFALIASLVPAIATDFSAAKKRHAYQPQYRASGPADPSFDRYGRPYTPTVSGPCMIDFGYGRFARCDGSL